MKEVDVLNALNKKKIEDWTDDDLLLGHVLMHKRYRERRTSVKEQIIDLHEKIIKEMTKRDIGHSVFDNLDEVKNDKK